MSNENKDVVQPSSADLKRDFHEALDALRKRFPMVYLSVWTPDDFHASETGDQADWCDPAHQHIAHELAVTMNSEVGVNWNTIAEAKEELGYSFPGEKDMTGDDDEEDAEAT